jgi:hypothetical protein
MNLQTNYELSPAEQRTQPVVIPLQEENETNAIP